MNNTRKNSIGIFIVTLSTILFLIVFLQSEKAIINYVELFAGIFSVICVVLVAYRNVLNYFFGIIAVILYGYVAFIFTNTGEWMLNWIIYLPLNILGIFLWKNKLNSNNLVIVKQLSKHQFISTTILIIILVNLYTWFLFTSQEFFYSTVTNYGLSKFYIDSFTTICSVVAMILTVLRYKEQWLLWILINILSIVLWYITFNTSMIIMWSTFLVNSIYGYYNWNKKTIT